jgi:hypothetical protein
VASTGAQGSLPPLAVKQSTLPGAPAEQYPPGKRGSSVSFPQASGEQSGEPICGPWHGIPIFGAMPFVAVCVGVHESVQPSKLSWFPKAFSQASPRAPTPRQVSPAGQLASEVHAVAVVSEQWLPTKAPSPQ